MSIFKRKTICNVCGPQPSSDSLKSSVKIAGLESPSGRATNLGYSKPWLVSKLQVCCNGLRKTFLAGFAATQFNNSNHADIFVKSGDDDEPSFPAHRVILASSSEKYDIRYLQRHCVNQMVAQLATSNVLDVLEIADSSALSDKTLKHDALNYIANNKDSVVSTQNFAELTAS
ncbi:OLC1v1021914C1 [Oldenlandia corymbosa var. corymbosa]|uniref:OLC1v1021914C1 n=1 Tax=Oldenlandia corymbosa var. corymbosa TaxID=529605 RepID=A0AAV1C8Z7_OLDCO|nr:OLC1v1021914C1 [Oldenlandia corymbosa var. corymbosa]